MDVAARSYALLWPSLAPTLAGLALLAGLTMAAFPAAHPWAMVAFVLFGLAAAGAGSAAIASARDRQALANSATHRAEHLEQEVRRHRAALDELANGLDVMVFLCDPNGLVLYANHKAIDAFRFQSPEGNSILAVTLSNELEDLIRKAGSEPGIHRAEINLSHPEERVGIAQAWSERQEPQRIFVSLHDITDLRRLERVRRDFVANVSHELRTPMTTIRAMAETLMDDDPNDTQLRDRYLSKILKEVDRLTNITDDLLTLSVAETGAAIRSRVDLAEIARSVVQQLQSKAEQKKLSLTYGGATAAPVMANESQMTQVIMNLVDNALNYTAEGSVQVEVAAAPGEFTLDVKDSGIGIATEHLPRIFERFYRVDKGRSRATGGTGLGLSIVRHIVEQHGGKITVESSLNHGSTFRVTLPAA